MVKSRTEGTEHVPVVFLISEELNCEVFECRVCMFVTKKIWLLNNG